MSLMVPELAVKRLELLKEGVPSILRVLVLTYLLDPIAPPQMKALNEAIRDVRTADDLPAAFGAGAAEHADGLLTTAESKFVAERGRVNELAIRHRLPVDVSFFDPGH
jgi:putative ABC transport system substrate-binding protein